MKWNVLSMADITACPDVLAPLDAIAEVVAAPACEKTLLEIVPGFDAYLASLHVRIGRDVIERAERLLVIATPSTGLDHIDLTAAQERGIQIVSLKDDIEFLDGITATAELAWALLLATVRRLPWAFEAARHGEWARDRFRGHQIAGKTLGILGYGRLGRMVAEYGKAFRMNVLACDHKQFEAPAGITRVDFDTLLCDSDVLSIHIHLSEENRGLLDAAALGRMKRGAIVLNTSRGAIIDEAALLEALESGHLGGAGLDVIDGEWDTDLPQHPLIRYAATHENLVISPHVGGVTYESQSMAYARTVEKLKKCLEELRG